MSSKKSDELSYLEKEVWEEFQKEIEFEEYFYSTIANSNNFEVIPIPCNDGTLLSEEEKKSIASFAKKAGKTLLFRVALGETALVFSEEGTILGIVPEYHAHGFPC